MKASQMIIATLKEAPQEAKIDSHVLLLRAGLIKNEVAGIYNYLPTGLRSLRKVEDIIREEMDKAGGVEILCSAIQPKEYWEESGRWFKYGPELMRLKDRHEREFCLGPTHEEVFTTLMRDLIKSSKQLPILPYQIQTKYRDELRPRFGLMRGREFIMKDAYSFDKDEAGLEKSYQNMYDTYSRIFTRFGLDFKPVLADTGAIGGNGSHQFMALSDIGESDIVYCDCGYAADVEKADAVCTLKDDSEMLPMEKVETPNCRTIEEVCAFLNVKPENSIKAVVYKETETKKIYFCFVRGDREVNEIKFINAIHSAEAFITFATEAEIASFGTVHGFVGPEGLKAEVLIDSEVAAMKNAVAGANAEGFHMKNVNFGRDFTGKVLDLRKAVEGDACPCCGKPMKMRRGIEVGQIFKLQTKYSKAMNCTYVDEKGQNVPMVMGCYGIGVTRTLQAIVEQYHDEFGIKWPLNVAPYQAVVIPCNYKDAAQKAVADEVYDALTKAGVEVVLDDRDERPGFKFKDWELIGVPFQVVVGKRAGEGIVEFKVRATLEKTEKTKEEAVSVITEAIRNIK